MYRFVALLAFTVTGCLKPMAPPPTLGYGAPYHGTGETIFVKDSRTDWDIHEGKEPQWRLITPEQALEASHDEEYEIRRQIMKKHNATLYVQAQKHRKLGYVVMATAAATFVGGLILSYGIAHHFDNQDRTPATDTMPEMNHVTASATSAGIATLGGVLIWGGLAGVGYGYYGAWHQPSYVPWHVPRALDNSDYIREPVEAYNAALPPQATPPLRPPPGVRRPPPPPTIPRMRGGRS